MTPDAKRNVSLPGRASFGKAYLNVFLHLFLVRKSYPSLLPSAGPWPFSSHRSALAQPHERSHSSLGQILPMQLLTPDAAAIAIGQHESHCIPCEHLWAMQPSGFYAFDASHSPEKSASLAEGPPPAVLTISKLLYLQRVLYKVPEL